jgi:DNA-binding CsgD family transcriptional regulator
LLLSQLIILARVRLSLRSDETGEVGHRTLFIGALSHITIPPRALEQYSIARAYSSYPPGLPEDFAGGLLMTLRTSRSNTGASARGARAKPRVLTSREAEVLTWVARGKSAREIGEILLITKRTVDEHVHTAARKIGASNRTHAVAIAIRDRLIDI